MYLKPDHARLTLFGGEANFGNRTRHFRLFPSLAVHYFAIGLLICHFWALSFVLKEFAFAGGGFFTIIFLETKGLGSMGLEGGLGDGGLDDVSTILVVISF